MKSVPYMIMDEKLIYVNRDNIDGDIVKIIPPIYPDKQQSWKVGLKELTLDIKTKHHNESDSKVFKEQIHKYVDICENPVLFQFYYDRRDIIAIGEFQRQIDLTIHNEFFKPFIARFYPFKEGDPYVELTQNPIDPQRFKAYQERLKQIDAEIDDLYSYYSWWNMFRLSNVYMPLYELYINGPSLNSSSTFSSRNKSLKRQYIYSHDGLYQSIDKIIEIDRNMMYKINAFKQKYPDTSIGVYKLKLNDVDEPDGGRINLLSPSLG